MPSMMHTSRNLGRRAFRHFSIGAVVCAGVILWAPPHALPELRPLVREMLENLGAVEAIGEGVALGNYASVDLAARDLRARAVKLKAVDLSTVGLDRGQDNMFDAYLAAQEQAAGVIEQAAKKKDARGAISGLRQLSSNACLPCHKNFRERAKLLRVSVLFMANYLSAWKDINRGFAVNDLQLVAQRAREIGAMGRVLAWGQVIQSTFGIDEPAKRKSFREHVSRVNIEANRIEQAAMAEDPQEILEAVSKMWEDGCISCHEVFRDSWQRLAEHHNPRLLAGALQLPR